MTAGFNALSCISFYSVIDCFETTLKPSLFLIEQCTAANSMIVKPLYNFVNAIVTMVF